jgi:2-keto-4-pentenoate hydratase/2-oxohepta-3-ene-1,7-dioic acid hydratase in catechol pathway
MRLCRYISGTGTASGVLVGDRIVSFTEVSDVLGLPLPPTIRALLDAGLLDTLRRAVSEQHRRLEGLGTSAAELPLLAPIPDPPKIWCIGLNYVEHAADLDEKSPDEPASFMRPAVSLRGPGDPICLPPESAQVTGEAELAVVFGRRCKYVTRDEALGVIAGFVPAIDMTAEDILRRNPRFLTRAKSFDTFLSMGPFLVTTDEVGGIDAVRGLEVCTRLNGETRRHNIGARMRHDVFDLISFHSRVMTWEPGDVLLTGTPGAVHIRPGDVIGCAIAGIGSLENPVTALPADGVAPASAGGYAAR